MANLNGFDANTVDPEVGFDPIPADKYLAMIVESEIKPTRGGNGKYLQLTLKILDGKYKNRILWARLNLHNTNVTTVQIARGQLSAICRAVGIMQPRDSVELHNIPLCIKVVVKKRGDNGDLTNEVKGFESKDALTKKSNLQPQTSPQTQNKTLAKSADDPATSTPSTAPWLK